MSRQSSAIGVGPLMIAPLQLGQYPVRLGQQLPRVLRGGLTLLIARVRLGPGP